LAEFLHKEAQESEDLPSAGFLFGLRMVSSQGNAVPLDAKPYTATASGLKKKQQLGRREPDSSIDNGLRQGRSRRS
jgi:hypothetical protein